MLKGFPTPLPKTFSPHPTDAAVTFVVVLANSFPMSVFNYSLPLKTSAEIALQAEAGQVVASAIHKACQILKPGITTDFIHQFILRELQASNAEPILHGVSHPRGGRPFPAACCVSINDEVVHGIPGPRRLQSGDLVSIDVAAKLNGWCADAAATFAVGQVSPQNQMLLDVGRQALRLAISGLNQHHRWHQVAQELESWITAQGFSLIGQLFGHGIGRQLHERPAIAHGLVPQWAELDFPLQPGLVLAIEPAISLQPQIKLLADGWTVVTQDGSPAVHFEHTVALTAEGPQILTSL